MINLKDCHTQDEFDRLIIHILCHLTCITTLEYNELIATSTIDMIEVVLSIRIAFSLIIVDKIQHCITDIREMPGNFSLCNM